MHGIFNGDLQIAHASAIFCIAQQGAIMNLMRKICTFACTTHTAGGIFKK